MTLPFISYFGIILEEGSEKNMTLISGVGRISAFPEQSTFFYFNDR